MPGISLTDWRVAIYKRWGPVRISFSFPRSFCALPEQIHSILRCYSCGPGNGAREVGRIFQWRTCDDVWCCCPWKILTVATMCTVAPEHSRTLESVAAVAVGPRSGPNRSSAHHRIHLCAFPSQTRLSKLSILGNNCELATLRLRCRTILSTTDVLVEITKI